MAADSAVVVQMAFQNVVAQNTLAKLDRVAAIAAGNLSQPAGPPTALAPSSDAETFSFIGDDPLIVRNESRLQVLEQALVLAE